VDGDFQFNNWSPRWADMTWSHTLLTRLVQDRFPNYTWDIDASTGCLLFLSDEQRDRDRERWGPVSALDRAQLVAQLVVSQKRAQTISKNKNDE
jgi:hypothetical protein